MPGIFDPNFFNSLFEALNQFCSDAPIVVCSLLFILGLCVGSFLNVVALRSLKEESVVWPGSYCPQCNHALSALDNIPLISYLLLQGKCRYCRNPISWQYPLVELLTGIIYAALAYVFLVHQIHLIYFDPAQAPSFAGDTSNDLFRAIQHARLQPSSGTLDATYLGFYKYGLFAGCLAFASTLIAVTITDFREKLIPHEITYPSMVLGIIFSALIRGDFIGSMVGIGASYMIFDFLAFYGLKLYMMTHKSEMEEEEKDELPESTREYEDDQLHTEIILTLPPAKDEAIEVMGGGDAVLSAVMSAYLGWQGLVLALVVGFLAGTVMGMGLLILEMKRNNLLRECGFKCLLFSGLGAVSMSILTSLLLTSMGGQVDLKTMLNFAVAGAIGGAMIGTVVVGTRVSKPFPFGPALALGGFVAMFLIPYWLPFY